MNPIPLIISRNDMLMSKLKPTFLIFFRIHGLGDWDTCIQASPFNYTRNSRPRHSFLSDPTFNSRAIFAICSKRSIRLLLIICRYSFWSGQVAVPSSYQVLSVHIDKFSNNTLKINAGPSYDSSNI